MVFRHAKHNLEATTDPVAGDDIADGYEPGSIWVNTISGSPKTYICKDNSAAAAVWVRIHTITYSTSAASGGQNGDIHFQHEA